MENVYRLYALKFKHGEVDPHHRSLLGRFMIHEGKIHHLEDHSSLVRSIFPEGPISEETLLRLDHINNHGYLQLVNERDLADGKHPEHAQPLDLGHIEPEARYLAVGVGFDKPTLVEVWDSSISIAGQVLTPDKQKEFMESVKNGTVELIPH